MQHHQRIIELKRLLLHEKELHLIWTFFLDHLAEKPEFINEGTRSHHAFVKAFIAQMGEQFFPKRSRIDALVLTDVPEHSLTHGAFFLAGHICGIFYFEDVQAGLMAIAGNGREESKFLRFSGKPLNKTPDDVSKN